MSLHIREGKKACINVGAQSCWELSGRCLHAGNLQNSTTMERYFRVSCCHYGFLNALTDMALTDTAVCQ
jgi:hypothetical protein